jgi:hypothetical protein
MALKFAVNNSLSAITTLPSSISGGALNLISTQTASASASLEFSLDDSYDSYIFKFINIQPATDGVDFQFNMSTDGGSTYAVTKTTTVFTAFHDEANTSTGLTYRTGEDLAQSTAFQLLANNMGNGADENLGGYLQIFNPSSTTFVKHFISRTSGYNSGNYMRDNFNAGYGNTTSAVDAIQFKFSTGNIDSGVIKLYGVS